MITNFVAENLICPKCGGIRFEIQEDFELKPLNSSKFDELFDATNKQTNFVCSRCHTVVKSFNKTTSVKVNFQD